MQTLTESLVSRLARRVSADARRRASLHLLDWIGGTAAAVGTVEGQILMSEARSAPSGRCAVVGTSPRQPDVAAFVNAGLGMVLELDDVHREARLHPGPVVIPAALAVAQQHHASGQALLDAIVRGYEAMIRVGESIGDAHYHHWHNTATCGTFGATAAAASILGLNAAETVDALGNAGTQSAGLWQCRLEGTMSKILHAGRAAQAGLLAARMAQRGVTGPRQILEGELGLYAATAPDADPSKIVGGPEEWRIFTTSLKPWPGCRHVHPAIDAALRLHAGTEVDWDTVEVVTVSTYSTALEFADRPEPTDERQAAFSLQHAVAHALVKGRVDLASFGPAGRSCPQTAALRRKVRVRSDPEFDMSYPAHWGARVEVTYGSGSQSQECRDVLGDPESPLDEDAIRRKCDVLLRGAGLGCEAGTRLAEAVLSLPDGDADALTALFP